jgi:hypothetical protein
VLSRDADSDVPTGTASSENGKQQFLYYASVGAPVAGSFIQYQAIDLSFMTMNNEVMQPVDVSVQRTSPVPLGYNTNGNNFEQIEEYIYIFSRPLNNSFDFNVIGLEDFRDLGLDRSESIVEIGGEGAGIPDQTQTIYAEKRMYSYNSNLGATQGNGEFPDGDPAYFSAFGMPVVDSVTTWGSMSTITGPQLHCYRIIINRTQTLTYPTLSVIPYAGASSFRFPPVNVTLLCKDPKFTEGEYLTRLANAMNSIPEDGPTA